MRDRFANQFASFLAWLSTIDEYEIQDLQFDSSPVLRRELPSRGHPLRAHDSHRAQVSKSCLQNVNDDGGPDIMSVIQDGTRSDAHPLAAPYQIESGALHTYAIHRRTILCSSSCRDRSECRPPIYKVGN